MRPNHCISSPSPLALELQDRVTVDRLFRNATRKPKEQKLMSPAKLEKEIRLKFNNHQRKITALELLDILDWKVGKRRVSTTNRTPPPLVLIGQRT